MQFIRPALAVLLFTLASFNLAVFGQKPPFPTSVVPDGLGYNIHFTTEKPGELQMLADSGATIIRMDFAWGSTERTKGVYDFSAYERLTDDLEKHKIRPLYILDYSNRHYDDGLSPHSPEGRAAFANWAAAAVAHFKGRNIIWEMYNEPNIHFWKPAPDPAKYILLSNATGKAIREAAPDELYIGPAMSEIDMEFLEKCFKGGTLEYWDAVSVHPYRQKGPETAIIEYAKLRNLIARYAPAGKKIPILSAEWGYSAAWANYDTEIQGKMLPRQWMVNLACDVPISIWYDWHDDGLDAKEPEHNFGTVEHPYRNAAPLPYSPKPAYLAAKTFNSVFKGFKFNKRFYLYESVHEQIESSKRDGDRRAKLGIFQFLFDDGKDIRIAAWTSSKYPRPAKLPCTSGKFKLISHLGEDLGTLEPKDGHIEFTISDAPVYLVPETADTSLHDLIAVPSIPLAFCSAEAAELELDDYYRNYRGDDDFIFMKKHDLQKYDKFSTHIITQKSEFFSSNPVDFFVYLLKDDSIRILIQNNSPAPYDGTFEWNSLGENEHGKIEKLELSLKPGETKETTGKTLPVQENETRYFGYKYLIHAVLENAASKIYFMQFLDDFSRYDTAGFADSWRAYADGDPKVGSEVALKWSDGEAEFVYRYDAGWKFACIAPKKEELQKIEDKPQSLGFWVSGDDSGNTLRIRFTDAKGQTFQPHGGKIIGLEPRHYEFPLDGSEAAHWGGPNDGTVHYPIKFDSIVIDGTREACGPNTIKISSPVLRY